MSSLHSIGHNHRGIFSHKCPVQGHHSTLLAPLMSKEHSLVTDSLIETPGIFIRLRIVWLVDKTNVLTVDQSHVKVGQVLLFDSLPHNHRVLHIVLTVYHLFLLRQASIFLRKVVAKFGFTFVNLAGVDSTGDRLEVTPTLTNFNFHMNILTFFYS